MTKGCGEIVFVSDKSSFLEEVDSKIKEKEIFIHNAKNGKKSLDLIKKYRPDVVIIDEKLLPLDLSDFILNCKELSENPFVQVIVYLNESRVDKVVELLNLGASEVITEKLNIDRVIAKIDSKLKIAKEFSDFVLEENKKLMKALTASLSHGINNPLGIIKLQFDVLSEKLDSVEDKDAVDKINKSIKRITGVLNEFNEAQEMGFVSYSRLDDMLKVGKNSDDS